MYDIEGVGGGGGGVRTGPEKGGVFRPVRHDLNDVRQGWVGRQPSQQGTIGRHIHHGLYDMS